MKSFPVGPVDEDLTRCVDDSICMFIAQQLTPDSLEPLCAELLDGEDVVVYMKKIRGDYAEFRDAELAFVIMHEWMERAGESSVQQLYQILVNANIDRHAFCKVFLNSHIVFVF